MECGGKVLMTFFHLGAGGDDDLIGFVGLLFDDLDELLPRVVRSGGGFVGVRQMQDFHQHFLGRLVGQVDAE